LLQPGAASGGARPALPVRRPYICFMLPTGAFAVAIGIGALVLIALVSMREPTRRRRSRDGGPIIPLGDADHDGDADFGEG
jgi:hypothetical protein